jgi:hypothetical protein
MRLSGCLTANLVSVQIFGTIVVAFVQSAVKMWMFSNVPDICTPTQRSHLTCPHNNVFSLRPLSGAFLFHELINVVVYTIL